MPRSREEGTWVTNVTYVFDGEEDLYLYQRPNSKRYQVYIKTKVEGVIRESTKEADIEKAKEYARERWYEIQGKQRSGIKVKAEKKLFDHIDDFLEVEKGRIVDRPTRGKGNITKDSWRGKRVHLDWLKKFYKERNVKVDSLERKRLYNYGEWRMKESGSPPKTTHTINAEISTIKSFFVYLAKEQWIDQIPPINTVTSEAPEELRRDYLTQTEWARMRSTLIHWKNEKGITSRQRYNREVVWRAILIMINSGLRIGELKKLRWKDIQRNTRLTGDDALVHHLIEVRPETTKTGKKRRANAPTMAWFDELRALCGIKKTGKFFPYIPVANREDFVFCKEGKPDQPFGQGTWDRTWVEIKERCRLAGGTYIDDKNITWYSFRHSYITYQVLDQTVSHMKLGRQCGTGIDYIQNVYYHHEPELITEELKGNRKHFKKIKSTDDLLPQIIDDDE